MKTQYLESHCYGLIPLYEIFPEEFEGGSRKWKDEHDEQSNQLESQKRDIQHQRNSAE